ncbi:hypothetical protein AAEX37_00047 [Oligella sp. MSHR50489EDL]|uniref:hypothetical protein n=1 Tax=Oligella sp. MSHR50489EDL TaxID=3139409 RepID=UPI003D814A42
MMTKRADYKSDIKLIDSTLLNLIKGRLFILIAVTVLVLAVLYWAAQKILSFGRNLSYDFLNGTAVEVMVEYLEKYDVYFWWAVVIILTLLVLSFINSFIKQQLDSHAQSHVPMPAARNLLSRLSPMSLEVLAWVWADRREPLKIEHIKQLSRELRQGRFKYIEDAREQEQLLNQGLYGTATTSAERPTLQQVKPVERVVPDERITPIEVAVATPVVTEIVEEPIVADEPRLDSSKHSKNATVPAEKDIIIVNDAPKA